jgi:hypothetical protein
MDQLLDLSKSLICRVLHERATKSFTEQYRYCFLSNHYNRKKYIHWIDVDSI